MRQDVIERNLIEDAVSLVKPASVHRRLYDDPAIYELELERIFGSAWIYVGHESQLKHAGDYFCTISGASRSWWCAARTESFTSCTTSAPIGARSWSRSTKAGPTNSSAAIMAGPIISTAA